MNEPASENGTVNADRPVRWALLGSTLALTMLFFAVNAACLLLVRGVSGLAQVWPGNAIAAALLIRMRRFSWTQAAISVLTSSFLANTLAGHRTAGASLAFTLINAVEIGLMVIAFRVVWRFPYPRLTVGHATTMTAVYGVVAPGLSSLAAGLVQSLIYHRPYWEGALQWWSSHTLGACLCGPPIILASWEGWQRLVRRRFVVQNVLLLAVVLAGLYASMRFIRFPYVSISLLLLVSAIRLGGFGSSLFSVICGTALCALWALGVRPLGAEGSGGSLADIPLLAVLATVMAPVAVGIGTDERRQSARALTASERRFRDAFDNSPVGIIIAQLDGVWLYCNRAMWEMTGYGVGMRPAVSQMRPLNTIQWLANVEVYKKLLGGEVQSMDLEEQFWHRDGHPVWTHVALSRVKEAGTDSVQLIAQVESLEARRQAADRLAEERLRLTTTLESIDDAVITTDTDLRINYLNAAAERLLAVKRGVGIGRRLGDLYQMTDLLSSKKAIDLTAKCIATGQPMRRDNACALHRPDGTVQYVKDNVAPVLGAGGVLAGTVIVLRDAQSDIERQHDLEQRATRDALTGLVSRGEFYVRLKDLFLKARHKQFNAALLAIDLDHFKPLNDRAGHAAGDEMLRRVADACRRAVSVHDTVARVGGDEFVVILHNCAPDSIRSWCQTLIHALNPVQLEWEGGVYTVGACVGAAALTADMGSELEWLKKADDACYEAKKAGRGQYRVAALAPISVGPS